MRKIVVSPRALADLRGIWRHTADGHGPDAADAYIRDLDQALQLVREFPDMGSDCAEVRQGYRRIGSHRIYYTSSRVEIYVVRVLHQRMDVETGLR